MSTAGRIQDMVHGWFHGEEGGYGDRFPGILESLSAQLSRELVSEIEHAVVDSIFGFVSSEQEKYRKFGAIKERERIEVERVGEFSRLTARINQSMPARETS